MPSMPGRPGYSGHQTSMPGRGGSGHGTAGKPLDTRRKDYPNVAGRTFYNPGGHRWDFISPRATNTRTAVDAQAAKLVAMNRDGIGTEIDRATLACPFRVPVQVNTGINFRTRNLKGNGNV